MEGRPPSPAGCCIFGSSRLLVQSEDGWVHHVAKLPLEIGEEFRFHSDSGRTAFDMEDWDSAIFEYELCRGMLLSAGPFQDEDHEEDWQYYCIEKGTYNWLLAWVDLPLALLYQYGVTRRRRLSEAHHIRKEMRRCVRTLQNSELQGLVDAFESYVNTALYEWACDDTVSCKSTAQLAVQSHARLRNCNDLEAESHMCLLLYFDHYYFGSWQVALRWIQAATRLWEQNHLPNRKDNYDQLFLRCEAELLIKLLKPEAVNELTTWLATRDHDETRPLHHILQLVAECYTELRELAQHHGDSDRALLYAEAGSTASERVLKLSKGKDPVDSGGQNSELLGFRFEDSHGNFLLSENSSRRLGLGCSSPPASSQEPAQDATKSSNLTLSRKKGIESADRMMKSKQPVDEPESGHGLDHHLRMLPLELGVAFCIHADSGRAALDEGGWEEAIVHFQMCRQMLKLTRGAVEKVTHQWLLVWVNLPLSHLFQCRAKKFNKALQLRMEMLDCVLPSSSADRRMLRISRNLANHKVGEWLTLYYPEVKESEGVKSYASLDGCNPKLSVEKMRQLLYWIMPSLEDLALVYSEEHLSKELFDIASSEDLMHRRRSTEEFRKKGLEALTKALTEFIPFLLHIMDPWQVFQSLCCITLYEWACQDYVEMKDEVGKKFLEIGHPCLIRDKKIIELGNLDPLKAEPVLCILLHLEHYQARSVDISLQWLKEAKRILQESFEESWKDPKSGVWMLALTETIFNRETSLCFERSLFEQANEAQKYFLEISEELDCEVNLEEFHMGSLNFQYVRQRCYAETVKSSVAAGEYEEARQYAEEAQECELGDAFHSILSSVSLGDDYMLLKKKLAAATGESEIAHDYLPPVLQHVVVEQVSDNPAGARDEMCGRFSHMIEKLKRIANLSFEDLEFKDMIDYLGFGNEFNSTLEILQSSPNHLQHLNPQDLTDIVLLQEKVFDNSPCNTTFKKFTLAIMYARIEQIYLMHFIMQIAAIISPTQTDPNGPDNVGPSTPVTSMEDLVSHPHVETFLACNCASVNYARKTLLQFADMLYTMTNLSTESWIKMLDDHKEVYYIMQYHYLMAKYQTATWMFQKLIGAGLELTPTIYEKMTPECLQKMRETAFLYSERQRCRVMLYQAGPNKFTSAASHELRDFDTNDALAMEVLNISRTTWEKGTVFVEYSYIPRMGGLCFIYVINQDGELKTYISQLVLDTMKERLRNFHNYMRPKSQNEKPSNHRYDDDEMHKDLEYFYEMLIKPIVECLVNMKPEQKLIFAPDENLGKVPFAALRDGSKGTNQGYLVQNHTISIIPSLRVFRKCKERHRILQNLPLYPNRGSIIAIGDPKYATHRNLKDLEWTRKEVECIEALFDKTQLVKLLGTDATANDILYWAQRPSSKNQLYRQAFIHIGAHATQDMKCYNKGVLFLARDSTSSYTTICPPDIECARTCVDTESSVLDFDEDQDEGNVEVEGLLQITEKYEEQMRNSGSTSPRASNVDTLSRRRPDELKAEHISGCKFEWMAEMVILSACDTASGEISAEGVLNLVRAFIMVGVPCIVASQWPVMDESTFVLMEGFYKRLKNGMDVASALRASMLNMLHNEDTTYNVKHWAPFTIFGLPTISLPQSLVEQCSVR